MFHFYLRQKMMQNLVILDVKSNKFEEVMSISFHCGYMGHFDYTGLRECVNKIEDESSFKGKFHLITMLRDPINRYISEFRYIKNVVISFILRKI